MLLFHIHQMVLFASVHHFCCWHFLRCTFVLLAAPCNVPLLSVFKVDFILQSFCNVHQVLISPYILFRIVLSLCHPWQPVQQQNHPACSMKCFLCTNIFNFLLYTLLWSYSAAPPCKTTLVGIFKLAFLTAAFFALLASQHFKLQPSFWCTF